MANYSAPVEGITGGYTGDSLAIQAALACFLGCALYSAIELVILVFLTFHVYRGLYFWSLLISTALGIIPQALGLLLKYFMLAPIWIPVTLSTFGWAIMVTGQSVVLYSRLHLLTSNKKVLRFVRYMIIIDAIVFQIPQIILSYGSVYGSFRYSYIYNIWAKVQLTGFFVQEIIISTIFIVQTFRLLRLYPHRSKRRTSIMEQLLVINTVIIMMDISLLALEYMDLFILQTVLKTFSYTVKLKLEFAVLSRLVSFVHYDPELGSSTLTGS
ncbi:integral membrane protein [Aspergillus sclerotioniger CBS 115572]|uniref:Integral membrane protein n=1 Tax=Aspergillus sclerotioniger CBS 115572 TaxID=1450535 RepID=A0A317WXB0_9EURO|nr:integral membrane protein [Aspergillus sclerotioniger CBS 115572]PWY88880.1 integral membrane protein [Aspergillus sclerotioniger CBS 115572]